jgi:cell division protein FtsB
MMSYKILYKNKFVLTSIIFIVWITLIDRNNLISQFKLVRELSELKKKKEYYLREIEKDKKATFELNTNINTLEKFAREKYLFKRKNEDIFLIVKE